MSDTAQGADFGEPSLASGVAEMSAGADHRSYDLSVETGTDVYNETAFRYFLGIERKRADRSNRSLLLLLVELKVQPGMSAPMEPADAANLFSGLVVCLRETDFIGWYRQGRVAGAVLTQHADVPGADASDVVGQRVNRMLCDHVSPELAGRIQVRVYELPPGMKARN